MEWKKFETGTKYFKIEKVVERNPSYYHYPDPRMGIDEKTGGSPFVTNYDEKTHDFNRH